MNPQRPGYVQFPQRGPRPQSRPALDHMSNTGYQRDETEDSFVNSPQQINPASVALSNGYLINTSASEPMQLQTSPPQPIQPVGYGSACPTGTATGRHSSYEEFFGGSMQCPSCRGSGRISRESENELVALIPVRDKRLKPRRTYLYVLLSVAICCTITGLLVFFLYPRGFSVVTSDDVLIPTSLYINKSASVVQMTVTNKYNISNPNFFAMEVTKISGQVFFDQRIMSSAQNSSVLHIPLRSMKQHILTFNITFKGDEGYIAYYCNQGPRLGHTLLMPFETKFETSCMGRNEEVSVDTYTHVKCSKKYETHTTTKQSKIITIPHTTHKPHTITPAKIIHHTTHHKVL